MICSQKGVSMNDDEKPNYAELTADIVSAYVSNNPTQVHELVSLIESVNRTISKLNKTVEIEKIELIPAVNPKKSIRGDYIICLEDGKKFKSLKRHLSKYYNLTPDEYREKWGLPANYPMTAPNYSAKRSEIAKKSRLGKRTGRQSNR
jgi:predicted transcriptional regulator